MIGVFIRIYPKWTYLYFGCPTADVVQFPSVAVESPKPADTFGLAGWLGVAGLVFGLIGTGLGVYGLTRKK